MFLKILDIWQFHIFALRWGDEIRRSSQLRTLLKRVFTTTRFSSVLSCEDLLISSPHRSANMWNFHISKIFTHLDVYLYPIHWPAPSWLVSSIGRALHRYRRGHGFKSRTGLNFFQVHLQLLVSNVFLFYVISFITYSVIKYYLRYAIWSLLMLFYQPQNKFKVSRS